MLLPFQELAAIATFVGATIGAVLRGHEAYEKFKHKKKPPKRKPRTRKKVNIAPAGLDNSPPRPFPQPNDDNKGTRLT